MAVQRDIVAADQFFMGEDKILELTIFQQDGVTPLDVSALPLEWNLKKTDKASDPGIFTKGTTAGDLTIVGTYNVDPAINTQRVWLTFTPSDTDSGLVKPNVAYRHSLKRLDSGSNAILTFGSFTFLQATEH